jgi:hypothetical protein
MPVPDFSPGEVLTAAAMDSIGLWLVKTQTIGAGVASVPVADAFSSNYENYYISLIGGVGSTGQFISMILTGSTANYYAAGTDTAVTTAVVQGTNNNNTASWSQIGYSSTNNNSLSVNLFGPNMAKTTGMSAFIMPHLTGGGFRQSAGFHNVATAYTGFTIAVGGTMTGGTIRVYGMRN